MKKTVSFSKESANIFFHILTKCNLSCRHCYINPKQHGNKTLSISEIYAWLGIFAKKSRKPDLIFLGGEPTLHPDLPAAIKKAKELSYNSITVDTNGYLFNDILSKTGPDEVDYFSFSLDGATGKTNDMIRGKGSFNKCIEGIKKSVSMGFGTSVIYTVSRMNIHELEMMAPMLEGLGIDRFFIQVIGVRGESAKNDSAESLQISRVQWTDIIPEAAQKVADLGITVTYPKVFLNMDETFECAANVSDNYFIFPNGRVYRCPLCEDFPVHSLEVKNNRLCETKKINENSFFDLNIPEGCVMNKIIQPENLKYNISGVPEYKIACCMLKEEINSD